VIVAPGRSVVAAQLVQKKNAVSAFLRPASGTVDSAIA